jgi:autotransporter-associated beta strand protein
MATVLLTAVPVQAVVYVYIGPGGTVGHPATGGLLNVPANWSGGVAPPNLGTDNSELVFQNDAIAGYGNYFAASNYNSLTVNKLTFNNADTTATPLLKGNNASGDVIQLSGTGAAVSSSGAGGFKIDSNLGLTLVSNAAFNCTGTGVLEVAGAVGGAAPRTLTKNGDGRLVLSNSGNSFGGTITINAGTLSAASLGLGSSKFINFGAATSAELEYTGATPSTPRSYGLSMPSGGRVSVTNAGTNLTLNGAVSGTTLTMGRVGGGTGTLTLAGAVTLSGASHNVLSGIVALTNTSGTNNIAGTYYIGGVGSGLTVRDNALARPGGYTPVSIAGGTLKVTTAPTVGGLAADYWHTGWNIDPNFAVQTSVGTVTNPVAATVWADQNVGGTEMYNGTLWGPGNNKEWRYTGKINLPAGISAFAENIDDNVYLAVKVGGVWQVVLNNAAWDVPTYGAVSVPTAGAYDIDIRMFNGGGGAGPVNNGGWWWWDAARGGVLSGLAVARGSNPGTDSSQYTPMYSATAGMFNPMSSVSYGSTVTLTASSTIDHAGVIAQFGALTIDNTVNSSIALTTVVADAAMETATFPSTTVLGNGTFTLTNAGATSLGRLSDSGANVAFVFNGTGNAILDHTAAAPILGAGSSLRQNGTGKLIAVGDAGLNPFGAAALRLGPNRTVQLSSKGGAYASDVPVTLEGNGTIQAGKYATGVVPGLPLTITLGGTNGMAINPGSTLTLGSRDNYVLRVAGAISGAGSNVTVSSGHVQLAGANTYNGSLSVAADARLDQMTNQQVASLSGNGTLVLGNPSTSNATLTITAGTGNSFTGKILDATGVQGSIALPNAGTALTLRSPGSNYSGGTSVGSTATLTATMGGALGTGPVTLDNSTLILTGGTLTPPPTPMGWTIKFYDNGGTNPDKNWFTSLTNLHNHFDPLTPTVTANTNTPLDAHGRTTLGDFTQDPQGRLFGTTTTGNHPDYGYNTQFAYSALFKGRLDIPAGTTTFWTNSDDGSMLWIDGQQVVNNNYDQGNTERSGTFTTDWSGLHDVEVAFHQGVGDAQFGVSSNLGGTKAYLPFTALYGEGAELPLAPQTYANSLVLTTTSNVQVAGAGKTATLTGNITGAGGLNKNGAGTLIVGGAGANSYAGPTVINSGGLLFDGPLTAGTNNVTINTGTTLGTGGNVAGPITLLDGGSILVGTPTATRQVGYNGGLFITSVTPNATKLTFKLHTPGGVNQSDQITPAAGLLSVTGGAPVVIDVQDFGTLVANPFPAAPYALVNYAGATGALGLFTLPGGIMAGYPVGDFDATLVETFGVGWGVNLVSNPNVWSGAGGDGMWGNGANWSKNPVVPDGKANANFNGAFPFGTTVSLDGTNRTIKALYLNYAGVGGYTITNAVTNGGILIMDTNVGSGVIDVAAGSHVVSAPMQLNDDTVATVPAGALALSGGVRGTGTLTLNGAGEISVVSAYSGTCGGFVVNGSGLRTLGASGTANVVANGAVAGNVPFTVTADAGGAMQFAGAITTAGGALMTKVGSGPVVLHNTNTVAGGVLVQSGELRAMRTTSLNSLPGNTVYLQGGVLGLGEASSTNAPGALVFRAYNGQNGLARAQANISHAAYASTFDGLTADFTVSSSAGGTTVLNFPTVNDPACPFTVLGYTRGNNYAARFSGYVNIPAPGTYSFSTVSDDGSVLWVDNGSGWSRVVNNNFDQGMTERSGTTTFAAAGWYPIDVHFDQGGGGHGLILRWDQGTGAWADMPNSVFSSPSATAPVNYGWNVDVSLANSGLAFPNVPTTAVLGNLTIGWQTLQVTGASGSTARFGGTATFSGAPTFDVAAGITLELPNVNDGGNGLTARGAGAVRLTGTNLTNFTGTITANNGGTVAFGANGVVNGHTVLLNGGNLARGGFSNTVGTLTVDSTSGPAGVSGAGTLTLGNTLTGIGASGQINGGQLALGGNRIVDVPNAADMLTIGSQVTSVGTTLTKSGAGTLTLTNASNSYGTSTVVGGGAVLATQPGTLGASTVNVSYGTLAVTGNLLGAPSVSGFGGAGWTINGSATIASDVATLTTAVNGQAGSAFLSGPIPTANLGTGFHAKFTYTPTGAGIPDNQADGMTFVLQNAPAGAAALGGGGGGLGYLGIGNSLGLALNIYSGAAGGRGMTSVTGGNINFPFNAVPGIDFNSTTPIEVDMTYDGTNGTIVLKQGATTTSPITVPFGPLSSRITGDMAYVGFTGGTGGLNAQQDVSAFTFTSTALPLGSRIYSNPVIVDAATQGSVQVLATTSVPGLTTDATLGPLNLGADASLNVGAFTGSMANAAYKLTMGATVLGGNATFNVNNNGTGSGTLALGATTGGNVLTKDGSGTLILTGAPSHSGNTFVNVGKLVYDAATGSGTPNVSALSTVYIVPGASVDAKGTLDPFTNGTTHTIVENSGNFNVLAGTKKVASINGTGTTTVTASLVAGSIVQDTLVIGAGGSVTIAASVPFGAADANAVPEPGTILLTLVGGLCLGGWLWRRRTA